MPTAVFGLKARSKGHSRYAGAERIITPLAGAYAKHLLRYAGAEACNPAGGRFGYVGAERIITSLAGAYAKRLFRTEGTK
ncbi:MAG: hypothetical protein LBK66_13535 [Spirochaetaceae bacterium]|jgi:hypothetical protein|nr:hypothetical protein [Spirochaetaceae bacterium]